MELARRFYSGVSEEVMEGLYRHYMWDFVLLGYSRIDSPSFPYVDIEQDFGRSFNFSGVDSQI